jgi:guanylate kinase
MHAGKLFIVSACSGAGKTSLVTRVIARMIPQYAISRIVTYTSKMPRPGEMNGVDYHFVTQEEFEQKIHESFFLEWSRAYRDYYGSPRSLVDTLASGGHAIIITDVQGAQALYGQIQEATLIWIEVSSKDMLKKRLELRNSETNEQIIERISISLQENEKYLNHSVFHYKVFNDDFVSALLELESIIKSELKKHEKTMLVE